MLPSALVSVYQQYKQDTDSVASWLASTAKDCGYPADLLTSVGPVKRKKHNKKASQNKHIVAIKDFVPLAEFIAASKKPAAAVPESFVQTINRVINVRSSFGSTLREHGAKPSAEASEKHSFFVGVLEKVREALRPRMPPPAGAERAEAEASFPMQPSFADAWINGFRALKVYEPSKEFLGAPDIQRPEPAEPTKTNMVYEAEAAARLDFEDAVFAFALMIDDLNKIRQEIRNIWAFYRDGSIELAAAAVATNTAVDLARNLADEIDPLLRPHGGFWKIAQKFYIIVTATKGFISFDGAEFDGKSWKFDFDPKTYDIADSTFFGTYHMLDGFMAILQPGKLPLFKPGHFGIYDPKSDWSRKTGPEKWQEDKILLMEACTDLMTIIRTLPQWPVEDELLRGMREMDETHKVPFYLVFAVQVYLDIHHLLRDHVGRGLHEMARQTSMMRNDLKSHLTFHANLKIRTWSAANDKILTDTEKMIGWLGEDPVHQVKEKEYRKNGLPLAADAQKYYLLAQSPVLAGLILYHYRTLTHEIGITVANAWGSITCSQHLYNALQQEGLMLASWPDMDIIISQLGEASFYVGGGDGAVPKNPAAYFTKFCLQMGVAAAAFGDPKKRRAGIDIESKAGPRGIKYGAPVSMMFMDRYVHSGTAVQWNSDHVRDILSHSEWQFTSSVEADGPTYVVEKVEDPQKLEEIRQGKSWNAETSRVPPERLVRSLAWALQGETLELAFPYLVFHRFCWKMMRELKSKCDPLLREKYTPAYMENETELPFVVGYILMANSGVGSEPRDDRLLKVAAQVLNPFADTVGKFGVILLGKMGFNIEFEEDE
ncbi:hypothetical protein DHEL01_v204908 [Diaporthe helianthi]|uniref:DUF6604 domain-containing protein n=1 Tax=Diaporthe helianthi TaxID=158607 RepID=A0A2P5I2H7_DIAHE|nr:hypothetical protein DHEL01_v204908 [Diaporthe helianthi]